MAHWAEVNNNNIVVRVLVTSNEQQDEGYSWLIDNYGGRWIKTSYNTFAREHLLGGTQLRAYYAGINYHYDEIKDEFYPPNSTGYPSWHWDFDLLEWVAPTPKPDSGIWLWDENTISWKEYDPE